VQTRCESDDGQFAAACGINNGGSGSGNSTSGSSTPSGAAAPLSGAALRRQMNQQLVIGVTNAAMQGAINGFLSSLARNNAAAQPQQQAFQQEMLRRQQELAEQQRLAEQKRIDDMFARLNRELKLEGLPFGLSLKGMNSTGVEGLQIKGMNSSGPSDLKLKIGDASPTSYGLKGLPGIYVGGPGGGEGGSSGSGISANASDAAGAAGNPNLPSGPASGSTGPGVAGLPGIYLDGAQPSQAPQLAQAAQQLTGPEKEVAEDTALQAAQQNPALTGASQDPQVNAFQQADQKYQEAMQADASAEENYSSAQARVQADQSAIQTAQSQLANLQPTLDQQAAMQKMLDVAGSDEQAVGIAAKMFDNANVNLSAARGNAAGALAAMAPPSNQGGGTPVVGLNPNAVVANLKPPVSIGAPVLPPAPKPAAYAPAPTKPLPTQAQLRARLEGIQTELRRLAEDEAKRGQARKEAEKDVNEAVNGAEERGVSMLFDLLTTGWDNCAPLAQGGVVGKLERDAARASAEIQDVYKEASLTKTGSDMSKFDQKVEELEKTEQWLHSSANQIERYGHRVTQLEAIDTTKDVIEKSDGNWLSTLEGVHKTIEMGLDDKPITDYLEKAAGMAGCHVVALKALSSAVESAEDIFKEGNAAEELRGMDENTMKFLEAQKVLDRRLKATTAQLNCYKLQDPNAVVGCVSSAGH
jgi:hypothetical protein